MAKPSNSVRRDVKIGLVLFGILVAGCILLILYYVPCTGFSACTTTSQAVNETNGNTTTTTTLEVQPAKTWWDWFQLAVIPLALAGFAWLLNKLEQQRQAASALDRMQEDRFQSYLDKMTDLLEKGLRASPLGSEMRSVARTRTLTVLRGLDSERKGLLLRFLKESGLIDKNDIFHPPSLKETEDFTDTDVHDLELNVPVLERKIYLKRDIALEREIQETGQKDFGRNPLIRLADGAFHFRGR